MTGWFAVMTQARAEPLADMKLRRLGCRTFFPHYPVKPPQHTKRVLELFKRAYLTRYLFVQTSSERIADINAIDEVSTVVTAAGQPFPIPWDAMIELMAIASPDGEVYRNPPPAQETFEGLPGDLVRIGSGPLWGLVREIKRVSGNRIWLLHTMFGVPREVEMGAEDVMEVIPVNA